MSVCLYVNNSGVGVFDNSTEEEFLSPLSSLDVDFSIDNRTWLDTAAKISKIVLQIVLIPWGLYEFSKYLIQRIIMLPLYPAQSRILNYFNKLSLTIEFDAREKKMDEFEKEIDKGLAKGESATTVERLKKKLNVTRGMLSEQRRRSELPEIRKDSAKSLIEKGYIVRHVSLGKNGVRYSGMMVRHESTIDNGNWVLQAGGNCERMENFIESYARRYQMLGMSTLMINGPSVGCSEGHATPESMGDAQEVGLSFLEEKLKAKKIVLAGRSLGGAAIAQAILQHNFKSDVSYLAVRQMTFDRVSHICGEFVQKDSPNLGAFVAALAKWSGTEIDSVEASKKLQKLGIHEVIIQSSHRAVPEGELPKKEDFQTDKVIVDKASLGYALINEGITRDKTFICLPDADHNSEDVILAPAREILSLLNDTAAVVL